MIRIDEIYNHTFWPFVQKNLPRTQIWFCDPPGCTGVEYLTRYDTPGLDFNYIFFFDQEPVDFQQVIPMAQSIFVRQSNSLKSPGKGIFVTSEYNSNTVDAICQIYDWEKYYYFFNGWAALDWFRGYDKTFLLVQPEDRQICHTFISPNRIIAGNRPHRIVLLYQLFAKGLGSNLISCPEICPAENISIYEAAESFKQRYPGIIDTFAEAGLPRQFDEGEIKSDASARLDLFEEASQCLLYLVTETVGTGHRLHLTEKIFKPICMKMPFVLASTCGSLAYLRKYGFKTFHDIWDEGYDNEPDDFKRMEKIATLLRDLENYGNERQSLAQKCNEIVEHNFNHFYNGGFENILWQELKDMFDDIKIKLSV